MVASKRIEKGKLSRTAKADPGAKNDNAANHKRETTSLLSFVEKPALRWLSERMPSWVTPDLLTLIGLLGSFVVGAGYLLCRQNTAFIWLASFGLLLNWFGDSLDGTLARYRKIERPRYGFFIDHTIDSIAEFAILLGVGLSGYVNFTLALFALIAYMMMSIFVFVYTFVSGEFKITFWRIGPTEMRMIVVIANALIFFLGRPSLALLGWRVGLYDAILLLVITLMFGGYLVLVIVKGIELNRLDSEGR